LEPREKGGKRGTDWFEKLEPYFDKKFGEGWKEKDREFWDVYDRKYHAGKDEIEGML